MTEQKELLALADRLAALSVCIDHNTPQRMRFVAGLAMSERDRDLCVAALRLAAKPSDPDAVNEQRAIEDAKLAANVREATIEECAKIAEQGLGKFSPLEIARAIRTLSRQAPHSSSETES